MAIRLSQAQELEAKKVIVHRILANTPNPPPDVEAQLMRESLAGLELMFTALITKRNQDEVRQAEQAETQSAQAQIQESRREAKLEAAYTHALVSTELNGRRLVDSEANRHIFEDLIGVDVPSAARYKNLALQYPLRFAWYTPQPVASAADTRAEFERICKENFLSLNSANEQLHREGVDISHWSGCSEVERQQYQNVAALKRQKFLINTATTDQLKQEARYEFQQRREQSIQEDAQRREQFVAQQQRGLYPPLPEVNGQGEKMDSAYFRRIMVHDYERFKALCKRHGSAAITSVMHQQ
jgi:hypothetical protein